VSEKVTVSCYEKEVKVTEVGRKAICDERFRRGPDYAVGWKVRVTSKLDSGV
jgi:hypothetical protein